MCDVNLNVTPGEFVRVFVNGRVVCEVAAARAETRDDLLRQVARARVLRNVPRIVADLFARVAKARDVADEGRTPDAKQRAFCKGLADGMAGKVIPHPNLPGKPYRPSEGNAYDAGYEYGDALAECRALLQGALREPADDAAAA